MSKITLAEGHGAQTKDGKIIIFTQIDYDKCEGKFKIFDSQKALEQWAKESIPMRLDVST